MSALKFNSQLYLDNLELQRFSRFIFEDGWQNIVSQNTMSYGIIKNTYQDSNFDYFRITQGTPLNSNITFQLNAGLGIANDAGQIRFIKNQTTRSIPFPQDGNWYWIKISPMYKPYEIGKVSIDTNGNLIGNGTAFTEILRGQPDFPSRIKFYNLQSDQLTFLPSTLNPLEYDVLQVNDDLNAILQGDFQNETDLYYSTIGTFTPGYVVPSGSKEIYQYDDCEIDIVQESSLVTQPTKPSYVQDLEFFIYRIKYDTGNLIIQDYRNEIYKTKADFAIEVIDSTANPLIGVEKIEYDNVNTPQDKNLLTVAWGFRSTAFTADSNLGKVTITGGNGGRFKSTNDFSTSQFDGWRLYILDDVRNVGYRDSYSTQEKYFIINSSSKNGSNIDLILDKVTVQDFFPIAYNASSAYGNNDKVSIGGTFYKLLDPSATGISPSQSVWSSATTYTLNQLVSYGDGTYISLSNGNTNEQPDLQPTFWRKVWQIFSPQILITPDVEEVFIEVNVGSDVSSNVADTATLNKTFNFPVREMYAKIPVTAINSTGTIDYNIYNIRYYCRNQKVYGMKYALASDNIGYINELGTAVPYSTDFNKAFIKVYKSPTAYSNFVNKIDTGDLFGVEQITNLENTASPLAGRLIPFAVGVRKENVEITGDLATPLTGDVKLNLLTAGAKSGSRFMIYFNTQLDNGKTISTAGFNIFIMQDNTFTLYQFTQDEIDKGQQYFICTYDSNLGKWQVVHFDKDYNGDCVFQEGTENVVMQAGSGGNIDVQSGKNILVVSGFYENISMTTPINGFVLDGIRTLNGKFINNLKLKNVTTNNAIVVSQASTYPSPPVGVLLFNHFFGLTDAANCTIKQNDTFEYTLNNGVYEKLSSFLKTARPKITNFQNGVPTGPNSGSGNTIISFNSQITLYTYPTITQPCLIDTMAAVSVTQPGTNTGYVQWNLMLYKNGTLIATQRLIQVVFENHGQIAFSFKDYAVPGDIYRWDFREQDATEGSEIHYVNINFQETYY